MRRNRLILVALAVLFLLPPVLGWVAHRFDWASGRTSNYGTLLAPRPVPDTPLERVDVSGRPRVRLPELRGRWLLVQIDAPGCDAYCEKKLYYMRQIRTALGEDRDQVERVWLLSAPGAPSARLMSAYAGTIVLRGDSRLAAFFAGDGNPADNVYLVDPMGHYMMMYPRDPDPSRMLKDLRRLMTYTAVPRHPRR